MKKILVIDDEQTLLTMLVETLQMLGFDALAAPDGASGIEMALQQKPDLILCDLNMPAVDGLQTLQAIRNAPSTATIPFILLSGFADSQTRLQAQKSGATNIITKPFVLSELRQTLDRTLQNAA